MAPLFQSFADAVKLPLIEAAIELNIAGILGGKEKGAQAEEIACEIGQKTDCRALAAFLDAMAAFDLLEKQNGRYKNTEFTRHFLDRNSPVFLGDFIGHMKAMQHKNLHRIVDIVRNGSERVPQEEQLFSETKWQRAVTHLAVYQRAGMAAICADLIAELPEFPSLRKILDIGGGAGLIGAEMLKRLPEAQGVLLDLPAIVKQAAAEIEKEGLAERLSLIGGDYNDVDPGSGYDLIWASHNLYYVKDKQHFYSRLRDALTDKGVLVCLHEGLDCERTKPESIVLSRLSLALEGQDVSFTKGDIAISLRQAGFHRIESRMLVFPAGEAELIVARKD